VENVLAALHWWVHHHSVALFVAGLGHCNFAHQFQLPFGLHQTKINFCPYSVSIHFYNEVRIHDFHSIREGSIMKEIYDFAVQLAKQAGDNTLKYFSHNIEIITKEDHSPVTIADRSTEELIREAIENRLPDDAILGEEYGEKAGTSGFRWILDPIDGTKSFIRNVPLYGTLIAVEHNGTPVIGVMRFPPVAITVSAMKDNGCYVNEDRCQVSSTPTLSESSLMTTNVTTCMRIWGQERFINLLNGFDLHRTWGDCFGYYLLATGKVDAMIDPKMHIWDLAPLIPIVEEAGGKLTNTEGECSLQMGCSIASNGKIHKEMLQVLK
jgi:histidinol phosphatase-like enzyme (inositol monophosphatase family)